MPTHSLSVRCEAARSSNAMPIAATSSLDSIAASGGCCWKSAPCPVAPAPICAVRRESCGLTNNAAIFPGTCDPPVCLTQPATKSPAGAGLSSERNRLLLAAREAETGEAEAEKRERGGFGEDVDRNRRHRAVEIAAGDER